MKYIKQKIKANFILNDHSFSVRNLESFSRKENYLLWSVLKSGSFSSNYLICCEH